MSEFVSAVTTEQAEGTCVAFAIVSTRDSLVLGTTRFLDLQYWPLPGDTRARSLPSVGEIGSTWLAAPSQGNGTNREAKVLMLDHAFDQWGTWRIRFQTDARNTRSRKALERLGARFEGVQRARKLASDGTVRRHRLVLNPGRGVAGAPTGASPNSAVSRSGDSIHPMGWTW